MQFGEVSCKNHKNQIWLKIHFKIVYHFSSTIIGSLHFSIFRQYICAFFVQNLGEEPKPKSTYAEYVRTTKYILALCLKHFQEKIFNIFEKSVKRCHKNATHGMVSWRSSATVYTYKYQQHLDDTKEVSTGIFKKKVLYRFFFKKKFFIIVETNGKCMGFKAEIESGHLSSF